MFIGQLVIIQIVAFVILILILRLLFYKHLAAALVRLKMLNEQNLAREEALKEELARAKRERESELQKGKEEAKRIVREAKEESKKYKDETLAQAKEQVKGIIAEAEMRAKKMEEESERRLEAKTIEFSCEMVKRIFSTEGKDALHRELISAAIKQIEGLDKEKIKTNQTQAQVFSAYALNNEQKKQLTDILSSKTGSKLAIKESIDENVVAGIMVKMGTLVIDGSLKNKLRRIIPYLRSKK